MIELSLNVIRYILMFLFAAVIFAGSLIFLWMPYKYIKECGFSASAVTLCCVAVAGVLLCIAVVLRILFLLSGC